MLYSVIITRLWCVGLATFSSYAVVPACAGIADEVPELVEELREGHVRRLVDSVVEQSSAPQPRVSSEQHAVDAGQALLGGVDRLQTELLPRFSAAPRLLAVIDAAEIVCTWVTERER